MFDPMTIKEGTQLKDNLMQAVYTIITITDRQSNGIMAMYKDENTKQPTRGFFMYDMYTVVGEALSTHQQVLNKIKYLDERYAQRRNSIRLGNNSEQQREPVRHDESSNFTCGVRSVTISRGVDAVQIMAEYQLAREDGCSF